MAAAAVMVLYPLTEQALRGIVAEMAAGRAVRDPGQKPATAGGGA
jgi:hypothetical protein